MKYLALPEGTQCGTLLSQHVVVLATQRYRMFQDTGPRQPELQKIIPSTYNQRELY